MFLIASHALVFGCQPQTFLCRLLYKWFKNLVASVAVAVLVHIIFGWQWKHTRTHRERNGAYAPRMTTSTNNTQPSVIGFLWEFSVATMHGMRSCNPSVRCVSGSSVFISACVPHMLNFVSHIFSRPPPHSWTYGLSFDLTFFKHFFKNSCNKILYHNYLNIASSLSRNESSCALIFIHADAVELKLMMELYWRFIISCWTAATNNTEASFRHASDFVVFLHQFLQRQNHPENIVICVASLVNAKSIMAA